MPGRKWPLFQVMSFSIESELCNVCCAMEKKGTSILTKSSLHRQVESLLEKKMVHLIKSFTIVLFYWSIRYRLFCYINLINRINLLTESFLLIKIETCLCVSKNTMPAGNVFRDNSKAQLSSEASHNLLFCTKNLVFSKIKWDTLVHLKTPWADN